MILTAFAAITTLIYGVYFLPILAGMTVTAWATRRFFEELAAERASCR